MILDWFKKSRLVDQLSEKRPLPVGMTEFEEWSDRIISGSGLPATRESQQWTLAMMMAALPATQAYESDGYFINCLRKAANSQVCQAKLEQIHADKKAREAFLAAEKASFDAMCASKEASYADPQPSDHASL